MIQKDVPRDLKKYKDIRRFGLMCMSRNISEASDRPIRGLTTKDIESCKSTSDFLKELESAFS